MVTFSPYPNDPRPRRAAESLLEQQMTVDLICLGTDGAPKRESLPGINILRLPIKHRRGGKLSYVFNYSVFIFISAAILAARALSRRYDLVYVHNMPDILVLSALGPKLIGAKVLLDLHDPMPELMTTIFRAKEDSFGFKLIRWLERRSLAFADSVITVNVACKRIFSSRSCAAGKITVVMNTPDEQIFPFRTPRSYPSPNGNANRRFVIMYHGSLVERNGLDLAVDALARVKDAIPFAELRVYGPNTPFLEQVMDRARKRGLQERVHWFGPRRLEDLVHEIEGCDVGIIPNHRSAFTEINTPTRIFEYLALGKPVIAPRTPGIQDYFSSESLVYFESGNAEDLARKMEYAFCHLSEIRETAERGQKVYLAHTWSQERKILVNVVSALLSSKEPLQGLRG